MTRRGAQPASATPWRPASRVDAEQDLLQAAFALSYFIHRDRRIAAEIVSAAMQKLEVAAVAQMRRLYYRGRPAGSVGPTRFKTSWEDRHLLQRLVYFESERWERLQEQREPASLTDEDYLLRFVKHLSQITMKRSSFYASIAVGRILHTFSTAETMAIYDAVAPEGSERKQGDYFRSRKAQLLEEVRERFGEVLSIVRGPHREERIEPAAMTPERAAWMRECLRMTTPWASACAEPEALSREGNRDLFDRQEVRRFHSLFHPSCFSRLARKLGLGEPASRLAIPRFRIAGSPPGGSSGPTGDREARLLPDERASIEKRLSEESGRRRDCPAGFLRVLIDGRERARWDPVDARTTRISIEESAEIVEVHGRDPRGDVLLAMHPLEHGEEEDAGIARSFSIVLESGQSLGFRIERRNGFRTVELQYRETKSLRAARLAARRVADAARASFQSVMTGISRPAAVGLLAAMVAILFLRNPVPVRQISASAPSGSRPVAVQRPRPQGRPAAPAQIRMAVAAPPLARSSFRDNANRTLPPRQALAEPRLFARVRFSVAETSARREATTRIELPAIVPLSVARESFLQGLTPEIGPGLSDEVRIGSRARNGGTVRDGAAVWAALAGSARAVETAGREQLRSQWSPPENSPRVRVLRRVVAPELSDGARCGPQELACPIARISSVERSKTSLEESRDLERLR